MLSFNNILPEDILLQTPDVCILKPEVKKGILIFHSYKTNKLEISKIGLKTNHTLMTEGYDTKCKIPHNCIFFRAPYQKPNEINYQSIETEIQCLYGIKTNNTNYNFMENKIWIRVDPRKTYTFSSEIRDIFTYPEYYQKPSIIYQSKKTMLDYLDIISQNKTQMELNQDLYPIFNLFSSQVTFRKEEPKKLKGPLCVYDVNKNSEVLVHIPILTPKHFVRLD